MKIQNFIIYFLLMLFGANGCKKDTQQEFKKLQLNIVGEWSGTQTTRDISQNTIVEAVSPTINYTFNEDGTGKIESFTGITNQIVWVYQYKPQKIVLYNEPNGSSLSLPKTYDILINESSKQSWKSTSEYEDLNMISHTNETIININK